MAKTPVVYKSTHRIKFSELDPYNHLRTAVYSGYYVDHRMNGLREHAGWDLKTLAALPFMRASTGPRIGLWTGRPMRRNCSSTPTLSEPLKGRLTPPLSSIE